MDQPTYELRIDQRDRWLKAKFLRDAGRFMAARQAALIRSRTT